MDQKRQIEEMAKEFCGMNRECKDCNMDSICISQNCASIFYKLGYRKQSEWISVEDRLPEEGKYVLVFSDSIQVARIEKGITEEQREKMKNGELPDLEEPCFAGNIGFRMLRRSNLYRSADVFGNNLVPYCWRVRGAPAELFGQRVSHWMPLPELPEPPKMKGGAE